MTISVTMDQAQADVVAGVEVITTGEITLRLNYDDHLGHQTTVHGIGLEGSANRVP